MKVDTVTTVHVQMTKDEHENLVRFLRNYRELLQEPNPKGGGASPQYRQDLTKAIADLTGSVLRSSPQVDEPSFRTPDNPEPGMVYAQTAQMPVVDARAKTDEIPAQPPNRITR